MRSSTVARDDTGDLTRRGFLQVTGLVGGGLLLGVGLASCRGDRDRGDGGDGPSSPPDTVRPHAFVRLDSDDRVTVMISKSEMGQGISTALAMIVADELGARWEQVDIERVELDEATYGLQATGGSSTVRLMWEPMREAGAVVRALLCTAAADRWGVDADRCQVLDGRVVDRGSGRSYRIGELAAEAAALTPPSRVGLRSDGERRIVGRSQRPVESRDIVTGTAEFGLDVRVPGMRFAAVARPPRPGATIRSFDPSAVLRRPSVVDVVEVPAVGDPYGVRPGIAVIATDTWTALQARDALRIQWDESGAAADDTEEIRRQLVALTRQDGRIDREHARGRAEAVLAGADRTIDATYEQAFLYHAPMEPMNCTALVADGRCVLWSPCQFPDWVARGLAEVLELPPDRIQVHVTRMGGGFGRRINPDFSIEAALVARAHGAPVQVVWSREDDLRHGFYRPMTVHRLEAALDEAGRPLAIRHRGAGSPGAGSAGIAYIPYRCPNLQSESADVKTAIRRGWWRSVTHSHTGFAIESFIDELSEAAGRDPIQYRLDLIDGSSPMPLRAVEAQGDAHAFDPARLRTVLELVRDRSGWRESPPAGRWRGVASHWCMATYVAEVVEISRQRDADYQIERVTAAVDCGTVVNPDGARAQVEGGIIDALSAARHQQVTATGGRIRESNFNDYRVSRISEAPARIDVHFVPSSRPPSGLGEPPVPPAAAALANALYRATGKRWRRQPFDVHGPD